MVFRDWRRCDRSHFGVETEANDFTIAGCLDEVKFEAARLWRRSCNTMTFISWPIANKFARQFEDYSSLRRQEFRIC